MEKFEKELLSVFKDINNHLGHIEGSLRSIAIDNHTAMEAKTKAFDSIKSIVEGHKDVIISALDELDDALQSDIPRTEESEEHAEEKIILRGADELLHSEYISPIEDLGFKIRTFNCVHRTGINTLGDLCSCTRDELLKRISAKIVDGEIIPVLIDHGYKLRTSEEQKTETNYKETEEE